MPSIFWALVFWGREDLIWRRRCHPERCFPAWGSHQLNPSLRDLVFWGRGNLISHFLLFVGLRNFGIGMNEILTSSNKNTRLLRMTDWVNEILTSHKMVLAMTEQEKI